VAIDQLSTDRTMPAYDEFFLAMAYHRLQRPEEARRWFDKARRESDQNFSEYQSGTSSMGWNQRLTLGMLRREAGALLGVENFVIPEGTEAPQAPPPILADAKPNPASFWSLQARAETFMKNGDWIAAKEDAVAAAEQRPEDEYIQYQLAVLLARAGDEPAYRAQCRKLLSKYADTTDTMWAQRIAKASLLIAPTDEDLTAASGLADRAFTLDQTGALIPFEETAAAIAAYRRGDWQKSIEWSEKVLAREGRNVWCCNAQAYYVKALAAASLGERVNAKAAFDRAVAVYEENHAIAKQKPVLDQLWPDFAICEMLHEEVERVLNEPLGASAAQSGAPLEQP
jgi:tetratricopeptide (TPR) repeat protein